MSNQIPRDRPDGSGSIKQPDDIECCVTELIERWENRLAVDGEAGLIKQYRELKCCLGLRYSTGEFKQFGFVFQACGSKESYFRSLTKNGESTGFCRQLNQPFMLSQNVELMERPQKVITSIIRAERFEDSYVSREQPLFSFNPIFWINEVVEGSEDWKVHTFVRTFAIATGQRSSQQVKGATEGIDDRADTGIDRDWQFALFAKYRDFLSGLRIRLFDCYSDIEVHPVREHLTEGLDLGFAPVDRSESII